MLVGTNQCPGLNDHGGSVVALVRERWSGSVSTCEWVGATAVARSAQSGELGLSKVSQVGDVNGLVPNVGVKPTANTKWEHGNKRSV